MRLELFRWEPGRASEGYCHIPDHLLHVTLAGTTARTEAVSEATSRYAGADFPGAVSFIPANLERLAWHREGLIDAVTVRLDPAHLPHSEEITGRADVEYLGFTNRPDPFIKQVVLSLREEALSGGIGGALLVDSLVTALGVHLLRRYSNAAAQPHRTRPALAGRGLGQVLAYIQDNLAEDLRLVRLAALAGMDRHRFGRAFKAATGVPPHEYVVERRVERAAHLLANTTLPIAEIAYRVGMSSQSHLTTVFRRAMGDAPHAYRVARN